MPALAHYDQASEAEQGRDLSNKFKREKLSLGTSLTPTASLTLKL
jgi:hypothetical protein